MRGEGEGGREAEKGSDGDVQARLRACARAGERAAEGAAAATGEGEG